MTVNVCDCSTSGGVHMHSDQMTFTAPTLMWVKVTITAITQHVYTVIIDIDSHFKLILFSSSKALKNRL